MKINFWENRKQTKNKKGTRNNIYQHNLFYYRCIRMQLRKENRTIRIIWNGTSSIQTWSCCRTTVICASLWATILSSQWVKEKLTRSDKEQHLRTSLKTHPTSPQHNFIGRYLLINIFMLSFRITVLVFWWC